MLLDEMGKRIRWQRERHGLKQQDVANALQVSPQAVSKWERGENAPDIAVLGRLARLLGVSVDWLLDVHSEGRDVLEATVFISSVTGAYEKSLGMAAREFAAWANGFFLQLTEALLMCDGVPIKYMGDQFLGFFSGPDHPRRAVRAAFLARGIVAERLQVGLSTGEVYLGAVGHPDYNRPDIMGEVVNIAFLTKDWGETHAPSGIAATAAVARVNEGHVDMGPVTKAEFRDIARPVEVCELRAFTDK